ncbi:LacI family DNA-binding transcriptional regulator [Vibrio superstes]|uniref:DNA-binding transcriptional regulator CytR n=1 Tax=Vibrio superstes NBRC 103154 TaxID=1219062 RepID=A0A511QKG4_9VIBR|nr:LacI family DNA-binding transcriptional regulator [Vibrio superstes]GEM77810.1 DNA-binding transcriptional regulator CytR [Vibrio superstes NBRC 103154]
MPTIKDVAKIAGVSTATVSRAVAQPHKVSVKTRQKVEQAIQETGFTPNATARNLRRNESKAVIVIVPDIANMFFADIVRGIQLVGQKHGYKVLLGDTMHTVERAEVYLELARSKQADGVISLTSELPEQYRSGSDIPMVMACEYFSDSSIPIVRIDNDEAAKKAIEYLVDLGHQDIGCITGPMSNPICEARKSGFVSAMSAANLHFDDASFESGDFSFDSGYIAFNRLIKQKSMTALFCFNDMMTLGAMHAAEEAGIRIPEQLSIVGFDDLLFSQYSSPPITTIKQPQKLIGETAMNVLIGLLTKGDAPKETVIQTQLLVRKSSTTPGHIASRRTSSTNSDVDN